jgi:hypothetical protein
MEEQARFLYGAVGLMITLRAPGRPPVVGLVRRSVAAFCLSALGACAPTARQPYAAEDARASLDARWVGPRRVPLVLETDVTERDLAALSAVFAFWGRPALTIAAATPIASRNEEPLLAGDLERFARAAGLTAFAFHGTLEDVLYELKQGRPVLVGVADSERERPHYEVVVGWDPAAGSLRNLDPARGFIERTASGFESEWQLAKQLTVVVFATEPSDEAGASTKIATDRPPPSPPKS